MRVIFDATERLMQLFFKVERLMQLFFKVAWLCNIHLTLYVYILQIRRVFPNPFPKSSVYMRMYIYGVYVIYIFT